MLILTKNPITKMPQYCHEKFLRLSAIISVSPHCGNSLSYVLVGTEEDWLLLGMNILDFYLYRKPIK